jgi:hypothetical protein
VEKFDQEYDPLTGVKTTSGFVDDKLVIHREADLSGLLERTNSLRNNDQYSSDGIKKSWFHVASIDPLTQIELLKIGVDIFRASAKEIVAGLKKINREHFITTNKRV